MEKTSIDALLARFEQLHPKLIDLSLGRIERLLKALGNPERQLPPVIHVAGTNGKGSVVAFMRAIVEAAGYRAHVFTSPHLRRFNERIMLGAPQGAKPIEDEALYEVLQKAERANAGEAITFFEITTAAAFLAFAKHPADIVLLETGLGGRLDATNVVAQPLKTVITPISFDHCEFLGHTIEAIAGEKAGIIKRGRPVVVSAQREAALAVIEKRARELDAPVFAAGRDWDAFEQHGRLVFQDDRGLLDLPPPRLPGRHQFGNAGTAIAALRDLEGFRLNSDAIAKGMGSAVWRARMERLAPGFLHEHVTPGSEIWLDGGHNPAGGEAIASTLADLDERSPRPIHLIVGMLKTKDAGSFLRHFAGLPELTTTIAIPNQKNSYSADELGAIALKEGLRASAASSLEAALAMSRRAAREPVRIVIVGSLYLAGEVLTLHEGRAG